MYETDSLLIKLLYELILIKFKQTKIPCFILFRASVTPVIPISPINWNGSFENCKIRKINISSTINNGIWNWRREIVYKIKFNLLWLDLIIFLHYIFNCLYYIGYNNCPKFVTFHFRIQEQVWVISWTTNVISNMDRKTSQNFLKNSFENFNFPWREWHSLVEMMEI